MTVETALPVEMRDVTDEEVAFYQQNGWVLLRGLISRDLAADALSRVKQEIEEAPSVERSIRRMAETKYHIADGPQWRDWHFLGRDDHVEPFRSIAYSKEIGRNAQRFIGRGVPVNYHADMMAVKMTSGAPASGGPTDFHQDWVNFPFDRVGFLTFWFALDEITPDSGCDAVLLRVAQGGGRSGRQFVDGKHLAVDDYHADIPDALPVVRRRCTLGGGRCDGAQRDGRARGAGELDRPAALGVPLLVPPCRHVLHGRSPPHLSRELGLEIGKPIERELLTPIYP